MSDRESGFPGKEKNMTDQIRESATELEHPDKIVEVSIATTAGFYPAEGYNRVSSDEKVEFELEKAGLELSIKVTDDWVAKVNGPSGMSEIDPAKTYSENGLSGKVEIDWGPRERGGG